MLKRHVKVLCVTVFCCLSALVYLAGCTDSLEEKVSLEGERIPVMLNRPDLVADPTLAAQVIRIPRPAAVQDWPQKYQNSAHVTGHIDIADKIRPAWSRSLGGGAGRFINPPVFAGERIFALSASGALMALEPEQGRVIWETDLPLLEDEVSSIPGGLAADDKLIYVTSGDGQVLAFAQADGAPAWQISLGSPIRSAPVLAEDKVFVLTLDNRIFALNTASGSTVWTHSGVEEELTLLGGASVAVANGIMVVPYSSGEVYALRSTDGRYLWHDTFGGHNQRNRLNGVGGITASPVIFGNVLFMVTTSGQFVVYNLTTGERLWTQQVSATQTPWVGGNVVYLVSEDRKLICLDIETGGVRWLTDLDAVLAKSTGDELAEVRTAWHGPLLAGKRLIVTAASGYALSFSPADGSVLSAVELPDQLLTAPIAARGSLYFLTNAGRLLSYR